MNGGPEHDEPERVGASATADALPADLDVTRAASSAYSIPDTRRRLIPAAAYLVVSAGCVVASALGGSPGLLAAAGLIGVLAVYHFVSAWPRRIDETEALAAAGRSVGFPIGHASAQLSWTGLRSRPVWRVLVYSAEDRPAKRGLVEVDGVDGRTLGQYVEENPEDW
ncbi:MAG: hypothetical protein M5T61_11150 [Acidimicrobiia bacterium]|nr:hypothetical protein [Acidimicrobiia bacterium]